LVFARKSGIGPETCVPVISSCSRCESLGKGGGDRTVLSRQGVQLNDFQHCQVTIGGRDGGRHI
jgi:hypothetical protein